jgi:hypothetical protein
VRFADFLSWAPAGSRHAIAVLLDARLLLGAERCVRLDGRADGAIASCGLLARSWDAGAGSGRGR